MRIIQLMGDGIEELYNIPDEMTDDQLKELYKEFLENDDGTYDFEGYLEEHHSEHGIERLFVDEIYV